MEFDASPEVLESRFEGFVELGSSHQNILPSSLSSNLADLLISTISSLAFRYFLEFSRFF